MIGLEQPEIGQPLSGDPITDKLVMAVNFEHTDAAVTGAGIYPIPEDTGIAGPGQYVSANVAYARGINWLGQWVGFSIATLNSKFQWLRSDFLPTTQGCTVLMLYEKADATARASTAFCLNKAGGTDTATINGLVPWVDGIVYWDYGGNTASFRLTASGLSFGQDRWVFSVGGRGMEIWQNGLLRASNGNTPTRTNDPTTEFVLGAKSVDAVFSDIAHYNVFAMWARQLTPSEILMVSADPYMLWEAPLLFYERGRGMEFPDVPSVHPYASGRPIYKLYPPRWG